ncbi:MAG: hypothetical protein CVT49_06955 [candidate division Zixibacteria bacterium HGW-Zixibacteria-1]|nr:MAG: hypothetical protein CVT49_06955 [candidate division Zixibacteria bacterium HGW-Zixibacteria-1]
MQNRKITLKNAGLRDENNGETETGQNQTGEINLIEIIRLLLARKKLIGGCVLSVMILTAVIVFIMPNQFRSTASILPSGKVDKMAQLKSLAGLDGFMSQDENSSELFPTILTSRTVVDAVLAGEYSFVHNDQVMQLTLPEYFNQDNPEKLRRALSNISSFEMDKKTGVISLSVETKYPRLSKAILSRYLEELELFNLHKRRSQAKDNVRYLEREVADREQQLRKSEEKLQEYQTVNRDWDMTSDPEILKNLMQLKREVEIKSKTYMLVLEQYELARLDVQKDVPIVRILDNPSLPTLKSGPRRMITTFLTGFLTLFLAAFWIIATDTAAKKGLKTEINFKLPDVIRRRLALREEIEA